MTSGSAATARVLVVANRTAGSGQPVAALRRRAIASAARFTLLVPATPRGLAWAADMKAGEADARRRLSGWAERMRAAGLEVESALVGDPDPAAAVEDELRTHRYDEVVVLTLPAGVLRRLRLSLPQRLRRMTELPVTVLGS